MEAETREKCELCLEFVDYCECRRCEKCENLTQAIYAKTKCECGGRFY